MSTNPIQANSYSALDERELGSVLAALRYWQAAKIGKPQAFAELDEQVAQDGGANKALSVLEIDVLCERLTFGGASPAEQAYLSAVQAADDRAETIQELRGVLTGLVKVVIAEVPKSPKGLPLFGPRLGRAVANAAMALEESSVNGEWRQL